MTNQEFLNKVLLSFDSFIQIGTSRSTAKLKPLHGAIANDIHQIDIVRCTSYGEEYVDHFNDGLCPFCGHDAYEDEV